MNVYVNGESRELETGFALKDLLEKYDINPRSVVIEKNEVVIPREAVEKTPLEDGDKIEIVRFVGGGSF